MCGIAGVLSPRGVSAHDLRLMTNSLAHRGPDDEGIWIDEEAAIGLGHRRLSIVDLSPAGHQPMHSSSGRFLITFNGEIYNHTELRRELLDAGHKVGWRGHSDTETLLAGFDFWGIKETLGRASGMFAFGLWDRKQRTLTLARDRLGEKPLYYGRQHGPQSPFLFASELKAFRQHPEFDPEIDREAIGLLVRYLDVPAPRSIYLGISKLPPGTLLTLGEGGQDPVIEAYWSGAEIARNGASNPIALSPDQAADELERILERAVGRQMMSDVPLGAFLSGGVDSSTVVAVMQKISPQPVKTFTIGFNEKSYNEAEHAKEVARHLGTDHTELYVTAEQVMDVIPRLPTMYDEPFADPSQIPTHLVSALARQHVTVSLSGDGGDELFGGYDRYLLTATFWDKIAAIPMPLRAAAARILTLVSASTWTSLGDAAAAMIPRWMQVARLGEKVHKGVPMLRSETLEELYEYMLTQWHDPASVVVGFVPESAPPMLDAPELAGLNGVERMMAQDMLGYLTDDILVKVDRAAMAVSLETRMPLLDPEVVEFAWRLPLDLKIRGSTTKWILKKVLYRHVPPALIERPKMGFGIPVGDWLRGPLRDWAEALVDERRLREEGFFHADAVRQSWSELLCGNPREQFKLWSILMFQSWLEAQRLRGDAGERQAATALAN